MMKALKYIAITFLAGIFVTACGSTSTVKKPLDQTSMVQIPTLKCEIREITTTLKDIPPHFLEALKSHLNSEFAKRNILNESGESTFCVDITVNYYRMRGGFTRVMFGVFAGKDGVKSLVNVIDTRTNNVIAQSDVSTFNVTAMGAMDDIARMHAKEIAKFVAGEK